MAFLWRDQPGLVRRPKIPSAAAGRVVPATFEDGTGRELRTIPMLASPAADAPNQIQWRRLREGPLLTVGGLSCWLWFDRPFAETKSRNVGAARDFEDHRLVRPFRRGNSARAITGRACLECRRCCCRRDYESMGKPDTRCPIRTSVISSEQIGFDFSVDYIGEKGA